MVNEKREGKPGVSRRCVLRGIGMGAAGAAATATLAGQAGAAKAMPAPPRPQNGYRETDHVRRVYELARF